MSSFKCSDCGCKESTGASNGQLHIIQKRDKLLCSECDPDIGKWHNRFPKLPFEGPYNSDKHGPLPLKYQHK